MIVDRCVRKSGSAIHDLCTDQKRSCSFASFGYAAAAFGEVAALLRAEQVRLAPLVTDRYPLAGFAAAYEELRAGTGVRGKVILEVAAH
jgi:threonine dehydrogenase-like Zn-dependent dehydrogenase